MARLGHRREPLGSRGRLALLPAGFLAAYLMVFGAPASAVLPHLCGGGQPWPRLAGLRLGLRCPRLASVRAGPPGSAVAGTGLTMFTFYAAVFLGLQYWGRVTSLELVGTYVTQAGELLRTLGHRPEWAAAGCPCRGADVVRHLPLPEVARLDRAA